MQASRELELQAYRAFRAIKLYNAVNMTMGFEQLAIHAPDEVIYDE